jgi:hypothetical protein
MVQSAGFYPHQNLIFARMGVGDIFVAKNLRTSKFMYADGFHDSFRGNFRNYHKIRRVGEVQICAG